MKTLKSNSLKVLAKAMFVTVLMAMVACSNQAQDRSSGSTSKVKPPQMDIHTAVVTGNLDAVQQHIRAGSNLNEKDPFGGSSPLISAAVFGKTEIAKVLIDAGVDLNIKNNDGSTALITAAFFCRPEIVQLLLDKGADKSIMNNYGATAYQTVMTPFEEIKETYDMMGKLLGPMGLKLDYAYIEKTRPEIAEMLK